ncbi:MAG: hypothetical protein R3B45_17220 [Bdellovibrionota bacterium]
MNFKFKLSVIILTFLFPRVFSNTLLGQSQERVTADSLYGNLTSPGPMDYILYFFQSRKEKLKGQSLKTPKDIRKVLLDSSHKKKSYSELVDLLQTAFDDYLFYHQKKVEDYLKSQVTWRAFFNVGAPPGFGRIVDKDHSEDLFEEFRGILEYLIKDYPMEEQSPDGYYLAAEIYLLLDPSKSLELAEGVLKLFKKSQYNDRAKFIIAIIYTMDERLKNSLKILKSLEKSNDRDIKNYAKYRISWLYLAVRQGEVSKLKKKKNTIMSGFSSVFVDVDDAASSPAMNYLSSEAKKDAVMFLGDISSSEDARKIFSNDEKYLTLALERVAYRNYRDGKINEAMNMYQQVVKLDKLSLLAVSRHGLLLDLIEERKQFQAAYKILLIMSQRYLSESSAWKKFHKDDLKLIQSANNFILKKIVDLAILLGNSSYRKKYVKDRLVKNMASLYFKYAIDIQDVSNQKKMISFLIKEGQFELAANIYFKIAQNSEGKSQRKKWAYRSGLSILDKLHRMQGDIYHYRENVQRIPAIGKKILKFNELYITEFNDESVDQHMFSSGEILYFYGHYNDAIKYLNKLINKEKGKLKYRAVSLLLAYYAHTKDMKNGIALSNIVLNDPSSFDKSTINFAKEITINSKLNSANDLSANKKYKEAVSLYLDTLEKSPNNLKLQEKIKSVFESLKKIGEVDLQEEIAKKMIAINSKSGLSRFFLLELSYLYERIGDIRLAQQYALRYVNKYSKDKDAPTMMYQAARYTAAIDTLESSAPLFFSVIERYPTSSLAMKSCIEAGEIYLQIGEKKKAIISFRTFLNTRGRKSKIDVLKARSALLYLENRIRTGNEKFLVNLSDDLAKSPLSIRDQVGNYFQKAVYSFLKKMIDNEVYNGSGFIKDVPLKEYFKSKDIKIKMIEQIFSLIKKTYNDEYIMAGFAQLGRLWKEFERNLKDISVRGNKDASFIKTKIMQAESKYKFYFSNAFDRLDSEYAAYPMNDRVRELLTDYFPERMNSKVYSVLRPIYTQHLIGID